MADKVDAPNLRFGRPHFSELVGALDFAVANDYPARGECAGAVRATPPRSGSILAGPPARDHHRP